MRYDEFLAKVRDRGEYADRDEAESATQTVLSVLGQRLDRGEARDLAAQLPQPAAAALLDQDGPAIPYAVHEFLAQIAEPSGATEQTAQWDAGAVLSTVAEAVSGGELNDVLTQLPSGYAELFGRAGLSG
ncbi:DUF2267 domain-containing protein [Solwaraspora sp. WMMD406]|uniref:DUF2267 domain-containing protein n=1 Tax=Solwaraspora sp. WMMD406 TaxID=3016095 RepID=UPI002417FA62|nr:DUF2267 domain-containing protein [Solwaraspora sp. WMMD406]MDG4766314.1 DUF2267 domain-containing protein [Solwaraspora sp. WMMD406]